MARALRVSRARPAFSFQGRDNLPAAATELMRRRFAGDDRQQRARTLTPLPKNLMNTPLDAAATGGLLYSHGFLRLD